MQQRLGQLDLLRGIALLGVFVVHASQSFPSFSYRLNEFYFFGRYGVPLFFAVSGFTMMMMYRSYLAKWENPVRVFYLKRILRLYPLFFVAAFAYIPLTEHYKYFNPDGLQVMDMVRVLTLTGGIDPHLLNAVVPGGWSIVDEIYFYLLFPLIFLAYGRVNMIFIGLAIAVLNALLNIYAHQIFAGREPYLINDFTYRNLLNNLIVFYAGIEAWRHINEGKSDFIKLWVPFAITAIMVQVYISPYEETSQILRQVAWVFKEHEAYMMSSAVLAFTVYWMIILAFRFPQLKQKHLEKIGTVTFTGYIIHFGVIALFEALMSNPALQPYARFEIMIVPISLVTIFLSLAIVPWTEQLWQNVANKLCSRWFKRREATPSPTEPTTTAKVAA